MEGVENVEAVGLVGEASTYVGGKSCSNSENVMSGEDVGEKEGMNSDDNDDGVVPLDSNVPRRDRGFLQKYGKTSGFGVSQTQSVVSSDKKTKRAMTWKCKCWGDPDMKINNEAIKLPKEWKLEDVILEHNGHIPTPEKAKLVKEYRMDFFNTSVRSRVLNDVDVGVSVTKVHDSIAHESEGLESMPITERDMRHVIDRRQRLKVEGGDPNAMFKYFERMQSDNDLFFHSYRVDEQGRLKDVFWAYVRSRVAYEDFGDVVCFDATYLTNKYKLPFANFVGVNHYEQSLLLGCAFLSREDIDTFRWVFSQWILCMGSKAPGGILTDQAHANEATSS
ncbi:Protein FAR-RED IMPAIRED RESPONSE 1 [Bienertia sinuspersici]